METNWAYGIIGTVIMAFCIVCIVVIAIARTIYLFQNRNRIKISERLMK